MKKIINVITDTNIGGAGKMLLSFLDNYDKHKFDILILLPKDSLLKEELMKRNINFKEVDGIAERSFSVQAISTFLNIYKKEKPHIIHTHASFSARVAGKLYGKCRVISTRHSVFEVPKYKTIFPFKQMLGCVNNITSDAIIAVSPAAKENIMSFGTSPSKIVVIFNGVEKVEKLSKEEKNSIRAKFGLQEDDFVCAIIARLEKVKGHEDILRACKMLQNSDPKIKILIAGTGTEEKNLKNIADQMQLTNCVFTGFIKEIYEIENIMDVQLNASFGTEATSLSLLEGMSLGIPAIVSDFGGNPFVIDNGVNGIVFPKRNVGKLCDAIMELKQDKTRYNEMSKNARRIYNKQFTSKAMTERIEKLYTKL